MTPPLDARHSARCGRSSIFREQGDKSLPARAVWQGGTHALRGAGVCGGRCHVLWAQLPGEQAWWVPAGASQGICRIWGGVGRGERISGGEQVC